MVTQLKHRFICYSKELVDGQPIYVSSNALPGKLNREPAGHSFHSAALLLLGFGNKEEEEVQDDDQNASGDKGESYFASSESYSSKGKKKSGSGKDQHDHYALLGLGHLRFLATEEQIRKSYRETALKHHPDKQASLLLAEETEAAKEAKKDDIENHFKAIQEAYEILMDPVRRRLYDSTDEFDDEVPTDCSPQDFFKVFGPAFMRNGRWSVIQPVPSLGEDNSPLKEVDTFYDFWYSFKSWREFPHADEFDLEQAETRDHKRWMERQNSKLREKARKEEHARVRSLIDNAYKKDPRIARRKEEEKAEKQRRKEAKYLAKKLQEEEAAKAAEEERLRKEEEDKQAAKDALNQKKIKEKEKKLLRKERARLRTVSALVVSEQSSGVTEDDVESLCMSFDIDRLRRLCSDLEQKSGGGDRNRVLKEALGRSNDDCNDMKNDGKKNQMPNGSHEVNVSGPSVQAKVENPLQSYEKKEKPWSKEEIELLRKGIQKYQKGTSRRWEVISEYIGTGRSVEEILKATKTVLLQKPDSAKAFDSFLEKRKPAPSIASPLSTRQETDGIVSNPSNGPEANGTKIVSPEKSSGSSNGGQQSADAAVISSGVSLAVDPDAWSAVQERALVQALKIFPKETNQRWERVSAAVPGKSVLQCKKKFAMMKENFRNKKS
ncbi:dnaJ homolog subfamily C member 2-like [Papaver somniferum]|uniref:dnaJ homolog subfamily C member 2-like n=1 Tax=Papaver somniferum TaxID=3469 RepID=UPI000E6FDA9B|nr:dnaJ homolog subfamily C member 2-like [Papaver somniferum]